MSDAHQEQEIGKSLYICMFEDLQEAFMNSKVVSKGRDAAVLMPPKAHNPLVQLDDRIIHIPNRDLKEN